MDQVYLPFNLLSTESCFSFPIYADSFGQPWSWGNEEAGQGQVHWDPWTRMDLSNSCRSCSGLQLYASLLQTEPCNWWESWAMEQCVRHWIKESKQSHGTNNVSVKSQAEVNLRGNFFPPWIVSLVGQNSIHIYIKYGIYIERKKREKWYGSEEMLVLYSLFSQSNY